MANRTLTAAVGAILVPILFSAATWQDQAESTPEPKASTASVTGRNVQDARTLWARSSSPGSRSFFRPATSEDQKISEAADALRSAETESGKAEAMANLTSLLSEDYDSRLDEYEEYLNELEEKLAKMRENLDRKRKAKADMIDLRIKVLQAEADDLGWPSRMKRSRNMPFGIARPPGVTGLSTFPTPPAAVAPAVNLDAPSQPGSLPGLRANTAR